MGQEKKNYTNTLKSNFCIYRSRQTFAIFIRRKDILSKGERYHVIAGGIVDCNENFIEI